MAVNDGSAAFPVTSDAVRDGMSLRDYFAGQALMGWIASFTSDVNEADAKIAAMVAYQFADAMLTQREVTHGR